MIAVKHSVPIVPILSLGVMTVLIYYESQVHSRCNNYLMGELQASWKLVSSQIETLQKNHSRLVLILQMYPGFINASIPQYSLPELHSKKGPTKEYESLRWRVYANTKEFWYYLSHQLSSARAANGTLKQKERQTVLNDVADRKRSLLSDQEKFPAVDGHEEWRHREAASVSDLVQRRLNYTQNPLDCQASNKVLCSHNVGGTGCHINFIVYCLLVGYGLERTVILAKSNSVTQRIRANIFRPISECTDTYTYDWNNIMNTNNEEKKIENENIDRDVNQRPGVRPVLVILDDQAINILRGYEVVPIPTYFIPQDLVQRIGRFNSDPYSWWLAQLVKYVLKLRRPDVINSAIAKINFTSPIVGVHIRRTDKMYEAEYHDVDEYMSHVADYYAQLELTHAVDQRRVYIATDDARVLKEAIAKYPQFKFYGDYRRTEFAGPRFRYSPQGMTGILIDMYALSMCDYLVCTFSSNVGRLAYKLMQTKRLHAEYSFTSLDDNFYFTNLEKHIRIAVMRNKNISLEIGDVVENGIVLRTNKSGRIPLYKTQEQIMQYPYPEYKQVPLFSETRQ